MQKIIGVLIAVTIVFPGAISNAGIASTTGQIVEIEPPPSVQEGQLESDTEIRAFNEKQDIELAESISVNITVPGTYVAIPDLTPGSIEQGACVSSHLVHIDGENPPQTYEGVVVFDQEVIGIITEYGELDASDSALGAEGTVYPKGPSRKFDLGGSDYLTLEEDRRTVVVHALIEGSVDQIRVITRGCVGPCIGTAQASTVAASPILESVEFMKHLACFLLPLVVGLGLRVMRRKT